jgi:hypothetical protein
MEIGGAASQWCTTLTRYLYSAPLQGNLIFSGGSDAFWAGQDPPLCAQSSAIFLHVRTGKIANASQISKESGSVVSRLDEQFSDASCVCFPYVCFRPKADAGAFEELLASQATGFAYWRGRGMEPPTAARCC